MSAVQTGTLNLRNEKPSNKRIQTDRGGGAAADAQGWVAARETMLEYFRNLTNTFYGCIVSQVALISESTRSSENKKLSIVAFNSSDLEIQVAPITKWIVSGLIGRGPNYYGIIMHSTFSVMAFQTLKKWDQFYKLSAEPAIKLLEHISTASVNNNRFILNKTNLPEKVVWRNKKLTICRNGKECFFKFMNSVDLPTLFEDINQLLLKIHDQGSQT
jgi:hypothetical protein